MTRMKRGREDREKAKMMHQRGIPGTVMDESQLQPLTFSGNNAYKSPIAGGGATSNSSMSHINKSHYST